MPSSHQHTLVTKSWRSPCTCFSWSSIWHSLAPNQLLLKRFCQFSPSSCKKNRPTRPRLNRVSCYSPVRTVPDQGKTLTGKGQAYERTPYVERTSTHFTFINLANKIVVRLFKCLIWLLTTKLMNRLTSNEARVGVFLEFFSNWVRRNFTLFQFFWDGMGSGHRLLVDNFVSISGHLKQVWIF